mgnify:CR=1 FL=1
MKKKLFLIVCAWLFCTVHAMADELVIGNVTVPQGGTMEFQVGYRFTSTSDKVGFTFSLGMPEGITLEKDTDGEPVYVKDATSIAKLNIVCAGEGNFAGQPANESATIKGSEGILLTLTLKANASLPVGSTHTVNVTNATFQERVGGSVKDITLDDFSFIVTIGEPLDSRTVLDETSTVAPTGATGDVRVKRTIKANEWSTVCLPFDMTEVQVKTAFGDDVQLADFVDYDIEEDTDENIIDISINFDNVPISGGMEANHPYLIKVGTPVTEFTVDNVDVDPDEDNAVVEYDNGKTGKKRVVYGTLYGVYRAETVIENQGLFLNSNKFWYSTGLTKIKAFRAYFILEDVLSNVENASAKIRFNIGDESTYIDGLTDKQNLDGVYTVQGQFVGNNVDMKQLHKGVYIVNGQKVIINSKY